MRRLTKAFKTKSETEIDHSAHLGEDMTPSPVTLAEKSASIREYADGTQKQTRKPYFTSTDAPARDFPV